MPPPPVISAPVPATTEPDPDANRRPGRGFVDLARRRTTNHHDVIIVAQVKSQVVGLLVDAVSDILTITDDKIQPTPDVVSSEFEKSFARGVLAIEGRMICLIELEAIFPQEEREAA